MGKSKWLATREERILWEDHSQPVSDDVEPAEGAIYYQTTGYVRSENASAVILCRDYGDQKDYCNCITILKKNIVARRTLK